jgi:isopenicillin-N epimerase
VLLARAKLLVALGNSPPLAPDDMIGSLAAVDLPPSTTPAQAEPATGADDDSTYPLDPLHDVLFEHDRIEVPVYPWPHTRRDEAPKRRLLRVSAQIYNDDADCDRLIEALSPRI